MLIERQFHYGGTTINGEVHRSPVSEIRTNRSDMWPQIKKLGRKCSPSISLQNSEIIVCGVTLIWRSSHVDGGVSQLCISYSSPSDAPPFLVVPEDIIAEPGETVLFNCQVTGDPPPELSWNKQNGDLPIGRYESLTCLLKSQVDRFLYSSIWFCVVELFIKLLSKTPFSPFPPECT